MFSRDDKEKNTPRRIIIAQISKKLLFVNLWVDDFRTLFDLLRRHDIIYNAVRTEAYLIFHLETGFP